MKTTIINIFITLMAVFLMFSCHDHEDFLASPEKTKVQFDSTQVKIYENGDAKNITLSFSKPAAQNGVLTVSVSNSDRSRFTIDPLILNNQVILPVTKNQQSVNFKISPINNSVADGDSEFTITLLETSADVIIGEKRSISVILKDDDFYSPAQQSAVDFIGENKMVSEDSIEGKSFSIKLSETLNEPGSIEILLASQNAIYGTHFETSPSANNGIITLNPLMGEDVASLVIHPIDNAVITGELVIEMKIINTTGSIIKGSILTQLVTISDDELTNKPKGYESGGGGWSLKKIYEYDETGRIKYVNIEKSTPATSNQKETYTYSSDGRIQKINTHPQIDIVYTWSNDKIIKSETIDNGIVKEYIQYDYDDQGNVSGTANYFRQPNGEFKLSFLNTYLYFLDNNLYKSQTYIPTEGSEELLLLSTRTYDHYIDAVNPFPMVEILPTLKTQSKLPATYTVEENGLTLNYSLSYEFSENGFVEKRIATQGNSSETTYYLYY